MDFVSYLIWILNYVKFRLAANKRRSLVQSAEQLDPYTNSKGQNFLLLSFWDFSAKIKENPIFSKTQHVLRLKEVRVDSLEPQLWTVCLLVHSADSLYNNILQTRHPAFYIKTIARKSIELTFSNNRTQATCFATQTRRTFSSPFPAWRLRMALGATQALQDIKVHSVTFTCNGFADYDH